MHIARIAAIVNPMSGAGMDPHAATHRVAMLRDAFASRQISATIDLTARSGHARELARAFPVLFLSGIPRMTAEMGDRARRFTWLVDILYDHRVKLVLSADAPAEALFVEGRNAHEFARTASRLVEMRSHDYMALAHASEETPAAAGA